MPIKKVKNNGKLPTAKDFPMPKNLTAEQKEVLEANREYVKALD